MRRADIDLKQFDTNHDGVLTSDELGILMVIPQDQVAGFRRYPVGRQIPATLPLTVDGVTIGDITESYIGASPSLGDVAHELSHLLLGTDDMYFYTFQPFRPGPFSLMDFTPNLPGHLDPFISWFGLA